MRWLKSFCLLSIPTRFIRVSRTVRPYLRDLYLRRLAQGPEPYRPRSAWTPWNGDAELIAFQSRIGERFSTSELQQALIDRSYYITNGSQSSGSEVAEDMVQKTNVTLAESGRALSRSYASAFMKTAYPRLPDVYVSSVVDYLLADETLAYTASTLGLKDLVMYSDSQRTITISAPPSCRVLADALCAVIGLLARDSSTKAWLFIRDFILTPLADADLLGELIVFDNPMSLLTSVLMAENRPPPEPRLQWQAGMNTILACYQVGIYSDRQLLGEAPGETIEIAEQEAARQSLRNLFGLSDHRITSRILNSPLDPKFLDSVPLTS